jgi:hypothetical protein
LNNSRDNTEPQYSHSTVLPSRIAATSSGSSNALHRIHVHSLTSRSVVFCGPGLVLPVMAADSCDCLRKHDLHSRGTTRPLLRARSIRRRIRRSILLPHDSHAWLLNLGVLPVRTSGGTRPSPRLSRLIVIRSTIVDTQIHIRVMEGRGHYPAFQEQ